jgi:hypothetical protein
MWARKYDKCVECGSTSKRHLARGLCATCYRRNITAQHTRHFRSRGIASTILTKTYLTEEYCGKGKSLYDIARECCCSSQFVAKKMVEYGIPRRTRKEARRLAIEAGKIVIERVDSAGRRYSVVHHKIDYNELFFSEWNPEMAYVLGVIFTDGCLDLRKQWGKSVTSSVPHLSIAQKDPELLRKILALLNCNATIHHRKRAQYRTGVAGEVYYVDFICTPLYPDLQRLGLNPRKSTNIQFPTVPKADTRHFIRGCWDGDGTVYVERKRNRLVASYVSGSLMFIKGLLAHLEGVGMPKRTIYESRRNAGTSYYFKCTGDLCTKLFHYLYDGVPPTQYLERKYDIFKKYCDPSSDQTQLF